MGRQKPGLGLFRDRLMGRQARGHRLVRTFRRDPETAQREYFCPGWVRSAGSPVAQGRGTGLGRGENGGRRASPDPVPPPRLTNRLSLDAPAHFPTICLICAPTSGGWPTTSFASFSSSPPNVGSISSCLFSASARTASSLIAFTKASRNILTRSAGVFGGRTYGRPKSPAARTSVARRLADSRALYWSISS